MKVSSGLQSVLVAGTIWVFSLLVSADSLEVVTRGTPVSRIVQLLQGLQDKLEGELETEEKQWKKYDCWAKSVKNVKAATNSDAAARVTSLQSYIADIDAGKIEFTTERVDLQKQIAGLKKDLQIAADLRSSESKDTAAAKTELRQAVSALTDAIKALEDVAVGVLTQTRSVYRAQRSLRLAFKFGRSAFAKEDLAFFRKLLTKGVPTSDWKKLNRKATFKSKYETRSKSIIATLRKLKTTFESNLAEVDAKEAAAVAAYSTLKSSKEGMLDSAETALIEMVEENGVRGLSKSEAEAEVSGLQAQISADEALIQEVEAAHDLKKLEWEAREEARRKELVAVGQAIALLHGDDARDLFKKAFAPQGYSLIQEDHREGHIGTVHHGKRKWIPARHKNRFAQRGRRARLGNSEALKSLVSLAAKSGDARFVAVAKVARATGLESVVTAIDSLLTTLTSEAEADLAKKEGCEADIATNTRQALEISRTVDGLTESVVRSEDRITSLVGLIKEQEELQTSLAESQTSLRRQREDEARQFGEEQSTVAEAIQLLGGAMRILQEMMQDVGGTGSGVVGNVDLQLAGKGSDNHRPPSRRGNHMAAIAKRRVLATRQRSTEDPPPPEMWANGTYGGSSGESAGITALLTLVKEDLEKDKQRAITDENEAKTDYDKQMADLQASIDAVVIVIGDYVAEKASEEGKVADWKNNRVTKQGELGTVMSQLDALKSCDWILVHFTKRVAMRNAEIDGLRNAKAVLQGADFS
eukprot:TRINITY_DN6312_c0_g1_i2.p1 TRINITY_DN6312_c0_g1~~TRINITY_DN6312_c0_g1_i2.p1  ORF type:complete len:757 (-),score=162.99 TRINITY_DN6312_c0_g1_i2:123-2393(-)